LKFPNFCTLPISEIRLTAKVDSDPEFSSAVGAGLKLCDERDGRTKADKSKNEGLYTIEVGGIISVCVRVKALPFWKARGY
jgi:hypothetical protein